MSDQSELKSMGLKATYPRLKILDIFRKGETGVRHMSAEDVYRALMADNVEIGLATVYRVLTQFEQAGILSRSQFDSGKAVFELSDGGQHDHLVCTNCGRVEEFADPEIEKRQQKVAKEHNFSLSGHATVLYGICPECNTRQPRLAS
jgi:Fur family ferric uptake transcriptional regulator